MQRRRGECEHVVLRWSDVVGTARGAGTVAASPGSPGNPLAGRGSAPDPTGCDESVPLLHADRAERISGVVVPEGLHRLPPAGQPVAAGEPVDAGPQDDETEHEHDPRTS